MSVSTDTMSGSAYQPFECPICQSRFTRHENLKRHAALHSSSEGKTSLPCNFCPATFSRNDLRHRHVKRKHPEQWNSRATKATRQDATAPRQVFSEARSPKDQRLSESPSESHHNWHAGDLTEPNAVVGSWHSTTSFGDHGLETNCHDFDAGDMDFTISSVRGSGAGSSQITGLLTTQQSVNDSTAIDRIMRDVCGGNQQDPPPGRALESTMRVATNSGESSYNPNLIPPSRGSGSDVLNTPSPSSPPGTLDDWEPSVAQVERGRDLFFTYASHYVPFIHQPTFRILQAPRHLLLCILCLAYQHGEDPDCDGESGSGASLSVRCFHQARAILSLDEKEVEDATPRLTLVQAYLLLQICAMMYMCGKNSPEGLRMHSKMVAHARAGGLMQTAPPAIEMAGDLDSLWYDFVRTESLKRTIFAVHQIDALWYQILSIPRQLSHLEIKHDLPCPDPHWQAFTAAEWAHQQLVLRQPGSSVKYPDAVRQFLSSEADLASIAAFDPYGAVSIAQFLISSAREISGWSTMTGMLSLERFEPLRSSLVALGPFIRQPSGVPSTQHAAVCQATWETAMIELQVWSPSHVGGIVEGSINSLLKSSTYLSPHVELLCESSIAKAVQPHVDWFLHYLDTTISPDFEAPWVTLYAYKAFLIAWQLVCGGMPGCMEVVGVHDGDVEGALTWAKAVFQRRKRWQLGRLILECLDSVGK